MKSKKAKSGKKSEKDLRTTARKVLQVSLAARFIDVINGLGQESVEVRKLVRKAARKISRKLSRGLDTAAEPARKTKFPRKATDPAQPVSKIRRPAANKELEKARKVVARAVKTPAPGGLYASTPVTAAWERDEKPDRDFVSPS